MIVVTIAGPAKCGKSILAQHIKFNLLEKLGDAVTIQDNSPHIPMPGESDMLPQIFEGTTIEIVVT